MAKILVVEDMDSVVDLLRNLLQREGFEVAVAQDGPEALEAVRREKPDLMLLDLILPGLDGLEVLRRVRQDPITAHLPIIVLSGLTDHDAVRRLESVRIAGFVPKPFTPGQLAQSLALAVSSLSSTRREHSPFLRVAQLRSPSEVAAIPVVLPE